MNNDSSIGGKLIGSPFVTLSSDRPERWANADVSIILNEQEKKWVIKNFGTCNFVFRHTLARLLLSREMRVLRYLGDMDGVPGPIVSVGRWGFSYPFIDGLTLRESTIERGEKLGYPYFAALEDLVVKIHQRGVVHLDLHGKRNILVTPQRKPALVDFGAAVFVKHLPKSMRRLLCAIDLAGVYKHWDRISPETMTSQRYDVIHYLKFWRRFWILKGYPLQRFIRKLR